ncbi:hypothetical protein [Pseudomonas oryzihabitans]|jgi:antibiotic biosynthesis monooxygenase (ABM) superfamily enzyme|uniref:Uncharacterized protein n=1 Tax=Pseudomonas oryzihabitans TaxID=47885 RepID=A0A1G5PGW4_9PSED|nr:hypothetical protein [Pseudomonas psychrotolerans]SCZ48737.1 hypothetical protein SAMN05216279_13117 [Pseudomonas psychrotolerans]
MNPSSATAILVVRHQVHPQHEQRYETWLYRSIEPASQFPRRFNRQRDHNLWG